MKSIRARAPVRFCDLGGWTDTHFYEGQGAVLNFAAALFTHATIETESGVTPGIVIESFDTQQRIEIQRFRGVEYNGVLDLVKAAIHRCEINTRSLALHPTRRLKILARSDTPPASGLGTSAALGVAAVAALAEYSNKKWSRYDIARLSQQLETEELKLECGVQDQMTSAHGGINFMEVQYPNALITPLRLANGTICELEERLVLVYTGKSHFSSEMHRKVMAEYIAGKNKDQFRRLSECAIEGRKALEKGDLAGFADAMNDNWTAQKALHSEITTVQIERLHEAVREVGALGFKANGAGGGGTVTVLAQCNTAHKVREAVTAMGMTVLPSNFDFNGLQVWEA